MAYLLVVVVAAELVVVAPAAQRLARVVGGWQVVLPHGDPAETTVSAGDDQNVRHRVFCDLLMPDDRRCLLRADHDGPCTRRLRR
ncbi:hypothetical protein OG799_11595 [Micromonospora sp. NBC_00898]|uniref:hypothetical protein n=1 Tax=Micromonospora sp. NBC_00898 TaxID=2975981 RepID=UPI00386AD11B|nr:hypothetical protein OG799_11595 [Micromonospora sp. NBC_00898]